MGSLFILLLVLFAIASYMLPTIIAVLRKKTNVLAIGVLNLFLGWSVAGWVVALVWALSVEAPQQTVIINNHPSSLDGQDRKI